MKIGIAGPINLWRFRDHFPSVDLPKTYSIESTALIAEELLNRGHDVSIFALSPQIATPIQVRAGKLTLNIGRYRVRHRARDFFFEERRDLVEMMRGDPCQVLHAHWTYEFALASLAVDPFSLITVRDWPPAILRFMPGPYRFIRTLMAGSVFFRGRFFTANSPYIQKKMEKWCRIGATMIPNGVPEAAFSNAHKERLSGEATIISINNGFFGRKNLVSLLAAFREIRGSLSNCQLLLLGEACEEGGEGHRWALENDCRDGVSFLGRQSYPAVENLLVKADLLIHPSLEESFGMTLIEAMAKGVPVIGGRRSGAVPWVLNNGEAGVLVDVKEPNEIARAAIGILESPERWKHFSSSGFAFAKNNFTMPRVTERYCEVYRSIVQLKNRKHIESSRSE